MKKNSILSYIKKIKRSVFTTAELSAFSGKSLSATTQSLNYLQRQGIVSKLYRGIWAEIGKPLNAYNLIPFLFPRHRAYLSFISALHYYGIVEQIPQVITLASTCHTKEIKTKLGNFSVHQISPKFFKGFNWHKKEGDFLIAEPEKALVDCLYLAKYKKKQFTYFPELFFPKTFDFKKAKKWAENISDSYIEKRLEEIRKQALNSKEK